MKPNPTKVGTLVKTIPGERHRHRTHVWRVQGTHRNIERLRTWKIEWLGACRKCDGFDMQISMMCRTVNEYGYHTDTTRIPSRSGCATYSLGGFSIFFRRSLPKRSRLPAIASRCPFLVGVLHKGKTAMGSIFNIDPIIKARLLCRQTSTQTIHE